MPCAIWLCCRGTGRYELPAEPLGGRSERLPTMAQENGMTSWRRALTTYQQAVYTFRCAQLLMAGRRPLRQSLRMAPVQPFLASVAAEQANTADNVETAL